LQILDIAHYSIGEQTKLLKYLNEEKFDLVHFTQFNHPIRYRGQYVITIQDLTMVGHLHRQSFIKGIAFRTVMKSAATDSKRIIAISKVTMGDVIDYYNTPKEKFDIIYHGVDHENYNMSVRSKTAKIEEFKKKYDISDEYILYTGMWKKHKNISRMLKAFEQFKIQNLDAKMQLVLVGKIDRKEPEVIREISRINSKIQETETLQYSNSNIQTPVVTTGFIEEEELPIAYAGAFAYCIPSLSEGFGWPPLEAMACGVPVIASKESCIPEILGDAPLYFDAYNVEDIAKKMKTIVSDKELRKKLIKNGLEQVQKYHWNDAAEKTLEVYKKMLN
jgi:glycosyltransferase involved in cell wall biosynthesis